MNINDDFDSLLLKSLLIHSASYGENIDLTGEEKLEKMGYGKPKTSNGILYGNNDNEVTLVLRDTLTKGKEINIMDYPFPSSLIKDDKFTGQIKVTLVYDSYLEKGLGPEYCQSDIDVKFGTYGSRKDRDTTKPTILNPIGREDSENLLKKSLYSKRQINNFESGFASERMLIDFGDKYYPVKKYTADLGELRDSIKRDSLGSERHWYLYLRGYYRDFIEKKAIRTGDSLSMDFCVVITIKDPTEETLVYSETVQKLNEFNFNYENISVESYINIDTNETE